VLQINPQLILTNNKLYPELQKGKRYLIEQFNFSKKSSQPKVTITENNKKFSVPLNRFKVPFKASSIKAPIK